MAGGIYVDQPFYLNPKCIIFGGVLMLGYWFLPQRNVFMLPFLFILAYIAMAWYDHFYECSTPLYSGSGYGLAVLDSTFKPQRRDDVSLAKDQEYVYKRNVYLFHLVAIVPLLLYIGIRRKSADARVFPVLIGVASLAGAYHFYRLVSPRKQEKQ